MFACSAWPLDRAHFNSQSMPPFILRQGVTHSLTQHPSMFPLPHSGQTVQAQQTTVPHISSSPSGPLEQQRNSTSRLIRTFPTPILHHALNHLVILCDLTLSSPKFTPGQTSLYQMFMPCIYLNWWVALSAPAPAFIYLFSVFFNTHVTYCRHI